MKRMASLSLSIILVVGVLASVYVIQPVRAEGTIYIRADGSIDPPTAPIQGDGDVYTLTGNINGSIVIERDNIVVHGNDYAVQGTGSVGDGFYWNGTSNVTVRNAHISGFEYGFRLINSSESILLDNNIADCIVSIYLDWCLDNAFLGNTMEGPYYWGLLGQHSSGNDISGNVIDGLGMRYGVGLGLLDSSCDNLISENNITSNTYGGVGIGGNNNTFSENSVVNNDYGAVGISGDCNTVFGNNIVNNIYGAVSLSGNSVTVSANNISDNWESSGIRLSGNCCSLTANSLTNNTYGIELYSSSNSTASENNISDNWAGIWLDSCSDNRFCHNNFIDNSQQVNSSNSTGIWDDGYPSGGNYWSDYSGSDFCSGPYQNETGDDEIGDIPYAVDANNIDHYPLMNPYEAPSSPRTWIVDDDGPADFSKIQDAVNAAASNDTIIVREGTYNENVIVYPESDGYSLTLEGESRLSVINGSFEVGMVCSVETKIVGFTILLGVFLNCKGSATYIVDNNIYGGIDAGGYPADSWSEIVNNTIAEKGIVAREGCQTYIYGNFFNNCELAIASWMPSDLTAINNSIRNSDCAFYIDQGHLINNYVEDCGTFVTIHGYVEGYVEVRENTVKSCDCGFNLENFGESRPWGLTYHNNFLEVITRIVYSPESSGYIWWNNSCEGNFWSDYVGTDSDLDGVGDTPYVIDGNNTDYCPLMNPYWIPADVNHDLKVGIQDVVRVTAAYGCTPVDVEWNPHADVAEPFGKIDILDVVLCTSHYGEKYP